MEDQEKSGFRDLVAVNLENREEVQHWLEHFDISEDELREAVANTNNNLVSSIAAYLKSNRE